MISVLYYTRDLNPPYFFSLSFSIGVYLPLLSPLIFPPVLTLLQYLKLRRQGTKSKSIIKNTDQDNKKVDDDHSIKESDSAAAVADDDKIKKEWLADWMIDYLWYNG